LRFGAVRFLLTGDVEGRGEGALGPVAGEVVKVPHHGSRSSSSPLFVAAASPRVAVVSAGFRNRFGHPSEEVVSRYLAAGARVFRTDRDGAVTVSTDGDRIWVESARDGLDSRIR
jgi:competence protein ComEC